MIEPLDLSSLRKRGRDGEFGIVYKDERLKDVPHIVKASGGRTSAFMLALILENGLLSARRGDCVLFNNTSAEHPATYDFIHKLKFWTEKFGIPFFMTEFCTYEAETSIGISRRPTYRLVNSMPYSDSNPGGYRSRGEVFEEFFSKSNRLPSRDRRICTSELKLDVSMRFLMDWFRRPDGPPELGKPEIRMTDDHLVAEHALRQGRKSREVLLRRRKYLRTCSPIRRSQAWQDFTTAKIDGAHFNPDVQYSKSTFLSLVGLRADEGRRVKKLHSCDQEIGAGEVRRAPLADNEFREADVDAFWREQPWNLAIPSHLGNCTFCFMKSPNKLRQIAADLSRVENSDFAGTPMDIDWWSRMERSYGRAPGTEALEESKLVGKSEFQKAQMMAVERVGFFEVHHGVSFESIKDDAEHGKMRQDSLLEDELDHLGCFCND